jgi:hypothetical protein
MSGLTYVTAYLNIYKEKIPLQRTNAWRMQNFRNIAATGIKICIIISPDLEQEIRCLIHEFPNIFILKTMNIEDTWVFKECEKFKGDYILPSMRNEMKDTEDYLLLQNSKMEFIQLAIDANPFNSSHFAWIDFSIAHMFQNLKGSQRQLQMLGECKLTEKFFAIPGCWGKWDPSRHEHHMENIHWRFCGCFFIADRDSMLEFCSIYRDCFPRFLRENRRLIWEVNIWPWMEYISDWKPHWYDADHNDRCILIPNDFLVNPLSMKRTISLNYPEHKNYFPTSAAYIFFQGQHVLNTRYVSYYLTNEGYYIYPDGSGIINNKNICSILEKDTDHWEIITSTEMNDPDELKQSETSSSRGLEDMRLYILNDRLRFICTTMGYSPSGKSRMMIGNYDISNNMYSDCQLIQSPNPDSWCEKNWVPVVQDRPMIFDDFSVPSNTELFIYKWHPMEIGKIVKEDDGVYALKIITSYNISEPWFHKIRGSTIFLNNDNKLLGVVHFSEEGSPRHYYHMIMELDPLNLKPIRYSNPFYFINMGVEFCIGFAIDENNYTFWISQNDRDPLTVIVEKTNIQLINNVVV